MGDRGPGGPGHEPRQGSLPGPRRRGRARTRSPSATSCATTPPWPASWCRISGITGLTLQRFPDGVGRSGFWQKDLPSHTPPWVSRRELMDSEGVKQYVVVDRVATLAWLAQEAAVELHPWTATIEAPDRPRYALIDIDPGETTTWDEVLVLARLFRTALEHLRVTGFPKTTASAASRSGSPSRIGTRSTRPVAGWSSCRAPSVRPCRISSAGHGPSVIGAGRHDSTTPRTHRFARSSRRTACDPHRCPGVGAHHVGRARGSGAHLGPLDGPEPAAPPGGARRPVRAGTGPAPGSARDRVGRMPG